MRSGTVTASSWATIPPNEAPPDFRLRDQDGRWASPRDARGKVLVVTFIYSTCRDLCPAQAGEVGDAVGKVGGGVEVYGVSVDPVGDTSARARALGTLSSSQRKVGARALKRREGEGGQRVAAV